MRKLILVIGLVVLIAGFSIISLTLGGVIQNTQGQHVDWLNGDNPVLNVVQMQPKEFLLFNDILDPTDRVHLNLDTYNEYPQIGEGYQLELLYNLSVDIKDSGNVTLRHNEYTTESLWSNPLCINGECPIDIYFQPSKYDSYQVFVTYKAWYEERPYSTGLNQQPTGPWVFYDVGTDQITLSLGADLTVAKSTPNSTYLTGGLVLVIIGVAVSTIALVMKQPKTEMKNLHAGNVKD